MTITKEQIAADKALCEKATEGPWDFEDSQDACCGRDCTPDGCHEGHNSGWCYLDGPEECDDQPGYYRTPDAAFIARARTALPEYIAELEALRARHKALFKLATKILDTEQHSGRPYCDDRLVPGGPIRELRAIIRGTK